MRTKNTSMSIIDVTNLLRTISEGKRITAFEGKIEIRKKKYKDKVYFSYELLIPKKIGDELNLSKDEKVVTILIKNDF